MSPTYLLIIVFPKFDPLTAAWMALYIKMSKFIPLSLRLSRIEFNLVLDYLTETSNSIHHAPPERL